MNTHYSAMQFARALGEKHARNLNPERPKEALAGIWINYETNLPCSFEDFCAVYHEGYTAQRDKQEPLAERTETR